MGLDERTNITLAAKTSAQGCQCGLGSSQVWPLAQDECIAPVARAMSPVARIKMNFPGAMQMVQPLATKLC
jgi:hypothetical protein